MFKRILYGPRRAQVECLAIIVAPGHGMRTPSMSMCWCLAWRIPWPSMGHGVPCSARLTVLLVERGGTEVDTKTAAPDGHGLVLGQIHIRRHLIVLITDAALECPEVDEASFGHRLIVVGVIGGHEIDLDVRPVRGLKLGQAQGALAIRELVERGEPLRRMRDAVETPLGQ